MNDIYFEEQFGITDEVLRKLLAAALDRGGDFADLYFQHSTSTSVGYEDGRVNQASSSIDLGLGIRVVVGDQTGYAFTEDLSLPSMLDAARTAAGIAATGGAALPAQMSQRRHRSYYDVNTDWRSVGIARIKPLLEKVASDANSKESDIVRLRQSFSGGQSFVLVVDSEGRKSFDSRPMTRIFVDLVLERNGVTQSNSYNLASREGIGFYTDARLAHLVDVALHRTRILFESVRPPAGEMPVVLSAGSSAILLHEAIGHGMEADFNRKGISIFSDRIGKSVAIKDVTIVDDGTNPNCRGSINFDDEGNDVEATVLVEDGILRSYMHDRISAKHFKVNPTGSGRRQSFRHIPMPRMRNTYMKAGPHNPEEIIRSVQKGIYCESFTNGQVAIGAGDYSFYVKNGYLIEDGKKTQPIKDVNIIGNGPESLARITMVGNDFEMDESGWTCGKDGQSVPVSLGMPTVLVSSIVVGGQS
jgi:TldD protein